ncbi:TlpA family protein disulfide reductase [Rhodovulum adriaticum]|uniref:Thiol-disulfide isomerase/thioredoxin n=1 Tax=Rhodovulum adriaticum TaxID=35804 RepID=A0A4R2NKJ2_RHOAD|nr:TlpA disulfide reductase family protein [Rhodovulum adriaticum]MBK1635476.1 thioredoxin [Rhodovulum adriaticum]TCP22047.1 thiol-disulfide isomerase/thioredoxin [Rhodovulum adriaticum]
MRLVRSIVLYTALCLGANAALAADTATLESLREGGMKKLVFHDQPRDVPDAVLSAPEGAQASLADYRGKWVVLNFWAPWCPPCRAEMPSLDRLQAEMGSDGFAVVTVSTGPGSRAKDRRLFQELGITALPRLRDEGSMLARQMGVMGLPVTVILDPEGREVARMLGDAEWDSDSAKAIVAALTGGA